MSSENFLKPVVPLVAAIIGGLIASGSAYLIQSENTDLTLRLHEEGKSEKRNELYRIKLEQALNKVEEIAVVAACLTLEDEAHGAPARCPMTIETVVEAGALIEVYGSETLRETANDVKNSYYDMKFFLDSQPHWGSMDGWSDDDAKVFKKQMDAFYDSFGGLADALVKEIQKYIPARSAPPPAAPSAGAT